MPTTHYYTVRNKVTGEKALVHAKNRSHAERGFFARRFEVELTSQHELLTLTAAGITPMDLTKAQVPPAAPPAQDGNGVGSYAADNT